MIGAFRISFLQATPSPPSDIQQLWQTLVESATSVKTVSELVKYAETLPSVKVRVVFKALRDEGLVKVERGKYVLLQKKLSDEDAVRIAANYNQRYENERQEQVSGHGSITHKVKINIPKIAIAQLFVGDK